MSTDLRALFTLLGDVFEERFGLTAAEGSELRRGMHQELEEHRSTIRFAIAFGRKPP
jgi:hypothetical protein